MLRCISGTSGTLVPEWGFDPDILNLPENIQHSLYALIDKYTIEQTDYAEGQGESDSISSESSSGTQQEKQKTPAPKEKPEVEQVQAESEITEKERLAANKSWDTYKNKYLMQRWTNISRTVLLDIKKYMLIQRNLFPEKPQI